MRKRLLTFLLLGLLVIGFGAGAQSGAIAENYGFEKGLRLSRILDRQFVFSFVQSGCSNCKYFKENVLSNKTVKNILREHFILSLVSIDSKFEIELPEQGKTTNMKLASTLGVKVTPPIYFSYPPEPGLIGNIIGKIPGRQMPNPKGMIDLLEWVLSESFKEDENGKSVSYNYKNPVKVITESDFKFLEKNFQSIPVVTKKVEPTSLPGENEIILDFDPGEEKSYANRVLEETSVKKIYVVSGSE